MSGVNAETFDPDLWIDELAPEHEVLWRRHHGADHRNVRLRCNGIGSSNDHGMGIENEERGNAPQVFK
jgi:hypothetical protein